MVVIITGGVKNGKSDMGETICQTINKGTMLYVATMMFDGEDEEKKLKIEAHRRARQGKGFDTIEQYIDIEEIDARGYDTVLLECVPNLVANEMFGRMDANEYDCERILKGIRKLVADVSHIVLITNDVFAESEAYGDGTKQYIHELAMLNNQLTAQAEVAIEMVCGLPLILKGKQQYEAWLQ